MTDFGLGLTENDTIYLFLHVPKTGGTYAGSRNNALGPERLLFDLNHAVLVKKPFKANINYPPEPGYNARMREDITLVTAPNRVCFATVRNPYDWLVSYWHHVGKDLRSSANPDHKISIQGFDYFVHTILERDVGWPCKRFLYFAFFAYHGQFVVDYLLHQDALDAEMEEFARESGCLTYSKTERKRVAETRDRDYRSYYSTKLVDLVKSVWGRELWLYGYTFENGRVEGIFGKAVPPDLKNKVRYYWETDKLEYGRVVI